MSILNNASGAGVGAGAGAGTPATGGSASRKKTSASDQVRKRGDAILSEMTDEERAVVGSKSHTLIFKTLLGLASKRSNRRVTDARNLDCSTAVGGIYVSTEDIKIPRISLELNEETGIDPEKDIVWVDQPANVPFDLTKYEMMFFITQEQYGGEFATETNPNGGFFSAKLPNYLTGKQALPTPVVNLRGTAIKANITDIDQKNEADVWEIKPEYKERYGVLIKPKQPTRTGGAKKKFSNQHSLSLAMREMLYKPKAN